MSTLFDEKTPLTARRAGLVSCHHCETLSLEREKHCSCCGASLHGRKPGSLDRTWALLITAIILYIPANLLPVMRVTSMGREQADTIMGGIIYFMNTGAWYLAVVIFLASMVIPTFKLVVLTYLLLSVHRRSERKPEERMRLYRLTEIIGRWSMVDIYVVAIMVALVELGSMATIEAAPGAWAFALVVITTMTAAMSFDPRLIWDVMESPG